MLTVALSSINKEQRQSSSVEHPVCKVFNITSFPLHAQRVVEFQKCIVTHISTGNLLTSILSAAVCIMQECHK